MRRALNEAPLVWNLSSIAHQQALIVTLGRIFDQSSPYNIDAVIRLASSNTAVFSKDSLAARKRASSPNADEWLPQYLAQVYEPQRADFRRLRQAVRDLRTTYQDRFDEIRDRYVAHREVANPEAVAELFSRAEIVALEGLLSELRAVHEALRELYLNGVRPHLHPRPLLVEQLVRTPLAEIARSDSVELAVYELRRCLEQLVGGTQ